MCNFTVQNPALHRCLVLATVKYSCIYKNDADSLVQQMPNTDCKQYHDCVSKMRRVKPEDAPQILRCQSISWYETLTLWSASLDTRPYPTKPSYRWGIYFIESKTRKTNLPMHSFMCFDLKNGIKCWLSNIDQTISVCTFKI